MSLMHDGCKVICKRHGECVRKLEENIKKKKKLLRNKYIDEDDYDEWCICRRSSSLEHQITLFHASPSPSCFFRQTFFV